MAQESGELQAGRLKGFESVGGQGAAEALREIRMISTLAGLATLPASLAPRREGGVSGRADAIALPSAEQTRKTIQDQRKALAQQKVSALLERLKALKLMMKMDSRTALKMSTEMARELRSAVKAYREAGGRDVPMSEMAMIRKQARDARDAQDASTEAAAAAGADAELKRANEAYGAAMQREVDRLGEVEAAAMTDEGFFRMVKGIVGALKEAREKIRADAPFRLSKPDKEDWKASDEAMKELEREIDEAGWPSPGSATGVEIKA